MNGILFDVKDHAIFISVADIYKYCNVCYSFSFRKAWKNDNLCDGQRSIVRFKGKSKPIRLHIFEQDLSNSEASSLLEIVKKFAFQDLHFK
jgi:hypothetical protein